MLPRNIFENSRTEVAIFLIFEQFSGKICLNVLP